MNIVVLGRSIPVSFAEGQQIAAATRAEIERGVAEMAALIDSKQWPHDYAEAFRGINGIVFFDQPVMVDGYLMDRPCCDQDDALFYWEIEEFLKNTQADVRANTFFHDCWHVVQFKRAGNRYAMTRDEQIEREVDAVEHQIAAAGILGCDEDEIAHLREFQSNPSQIGVRLDEGVEQLVPHRTGAIRNI